MQQLDRVLAIEFTLDISLPYQSSKAVNGFSLQAHAGKNSTVFCVRLLMLLVRER